MNRRSWITGHFENGGAFAGYVAVSEAGLAGKPASVSFEEAAAVPTSGIIALRSLVHEGGLRAGQRVLINGAGGALGSFAVQIAKAYGAEVVAIDVQEKAEFLKTLGAHLVIPAHPFDLSAFWGVLPRAIGLMLRALFDKQLPKAAFSLQGGPLMRSLAEMLEQEKIRPQVGAVFPLSEARQALATLVSGQVFGKIVLKV